jgi:DNA-binding beta-propeller fold protein YncE
MLRSTALNRVGVPPGQAALALSPDGSRGYLSTGDRLVVVDPRGSQSSELSLGGSASAGTPVSVGGIAVAPDGTIYAVVRDGGIAVVTPNPLQVTQRIGQDRQFTSVGVSTDGKYLYALQKDGTYVVMTPTTGDVVLHRPNVGSLAILQVTPGE